jgi:hypothetical protein
MIKKNLVRFGLTFCAAALLMFISAGPAAASTQTFREQSSFSVFVPCANGGSGELVEGIVKVHVVFGITEDGAGGFHAHVQVKLQGAGLGTETGDAYRLHADIPEIFFDRLNENAGGSYNAALDYSVDAIGMGDAPTYSLNAHAQVTINANGVVTMEKGDLTPVETCN